MGFWSGAKSSSQTDSYSGLRGTSQFGRTAGDIGKGYQFGINLARNRASEDNPLGLNTTGLTDAQQAGFDKLAGNLFSQFSGSGAARGMLSPENVGAIGGSALTQAAPQLIGQILQNQMAGETAKQGRFAALSDILGSGSQALGSETHSRSEQTEGGIGNFLAKSAISNWFEMWKNIGSSWGGGGGGAAAMCWIAEALFGKTDIRTHCARWYVNHILPHSLSGRVFRYWYSRYGQEVARRIPSSPLLRLLLTPVFTYLANQGARYWSMFATK